MKHLTKAYNCDIINNNDSDYTANTNTIIRRKYNGL
jgi:hypothetical protein